MSGVCDDDKRSTAVSRIIRKIAVADSVFIESRLDEGLLTLTLKRPPLNVLHIALLHELAALLEGAAQDERVRMLLLTGQGEKFFSAGVDVAEHAAEHIAGMLKAFHRAVRLLRDFPLPTLAVLKGSALGGGLELALACDMIVADEGAQLGQPEICLGVFAPVAAILLPRLLPPALANEMLLSGTTIDAATALQYGLVNRVFPREGFDQAVTAFLQTCLQHSRSAQMHNKQALRMAVGLPFDEALNRLETHYLQSLMATADAQEGIASFLEKRPAHWSHR